MYVILITLVKALPKHSDSIWSKSIALGQDYKIIYSYAIRDKASVFLQNPCDILCKLVQDEKDWKEQANKARFFSAQDRVCFE